MTSLPTNLPTKEDVRAVLEICADNGHSIFKAETFQDAGVNMDLVPIHTYKSDGTPKGTVSVAGVAVKELRGVYSLDLLASLANRLGLKWAPKTGRGFEAREITRALQEWLER